MNNQQFIYFPTKKKCEREDKEKKNANFIFFYFKEMWNEVKEKNDWGLMQQGFIWIYINNMKKYTGFD